MAIFLIGADDCILGGRFFACLLDTREWIFSNACLFVCSHAWERKKKATYYRSDCNESQNK